MAHRPTGRLQVLAASLTVLALTASPAAHAGILGPDSGNTEVANGTGNLTSRSTTGTINFAVYKNSGHGGNDVFGTGFTNLDMLGVTKFNTKSTNLGPSAHAGFDSHARYLYLYQISNNGPGRITVNATLPVDPRSVTSYGVLVDHKTPLGLKDNRGLVTGATMSYRGANNFGPETFALTAQEQRLVSLHGGSLPPWAQGTIGQLVGFTQNANASLLGSGATLSAMQPGVADDPDAFGRITLNLQSNDLLVDFPRGAFGFGSTSELIFITSNSPPTFGNGSLFGDDGPGPALGQVAGPSFNAAPAPPSVVLCLLGVALFAAFHRVRRRVSTQATLNA
jgi:hypothetical protein